MKYPYTEKQLMPFRLISQCRQSTWWRVEAFNYLTGTKEFFNIGSSTVLCKALFRNYNPKYNVQKGDFFLVNRSTRIYRSNGSGTVSYRGVPKQKWIPWREANLEYFI